MTLPSETDKRVLVVGNSDGIGLAFTRRILAEGWTVTGVSRRASPIVDPGYEHAVLDVAAPGYREDLAAVAGRRGPFGLCVYCAGIGEAIDPDALSREAVVVRVNFVGAVETAEIALPSMISAGKGHFVSLSSMGDGMSAVAPSYAASKAGLSSWLGGLFLALRPRGVHVTNVRFGFVDTKMAKSKSRPMMVSVDRAVDVLFECLADKPARRTFPRLMQLPMMVLGWIHSVKLWWA